MAVSCFFCENLLSDFIEGILPSSRHEEIKTHIAQCAKCKQIELELQKTISFVKKMPLSPLSHELELRIIEAAQFQKSRRLIENLISKWTMGTLAAAVLLFALAFQMPQYFSWMSVFHLRGDEGEFSRYFPLLNGAEEILDEQASLYYAKAPGTGSLWDEGGMTPEEFEKSFQKKSPVGSFGPDK